MNAVLGVVALVLVFAGFMIWECSEWVSARAELVREQARKLRLENDRLEAGRESSIDGRCTQG